MGGREGGPPGATVRQATREDHEDVAAFTEDTWADRGGDYLPRVFEEWVEADGPRRRTFVLDTGDGAVGVVRGVLLSDHEAWAGGIRVAPDYRGQGAGHRLVDALFDWAADRGATVCRNLVFSWNAAGLGQSVGAGFEPVAGFRWAHPTPDAGASLAPASGSGPGSGADDVPDPDPGGGGAADLAVVEDADAAWSCWARSDARDHLAGLALDDREPWALSELTRERLRATAAERTVLTVQNRSGTRGMTVRTRTLEREREGDGEEETWAEYGVAAWDGPASASALLAAVARDAAALGADRTRVIVPETPRHVAEAGYARAELGESPDVVFEADLTRR